MFRAIFLLFSCALMCILAHDKFIIGDETEFNENIHFITKYHKGDPKIDDTHPVEMLTPIKIVDGVMHYSIGARTHYDNLVATGKQNNSWPAPHNVNVQLTYPPQGYGPIITYVAIVVNQTSNLGRAYVVNGGINQRQISIVVEALNTYVFNWVAYIYGAN